MDRHDFVEYKLPYPVTVGVKQWVLKRSKCFRIRKLFFKKRLSHPLLRCKNGTGVVCLVVVVIYLQ